MASDDPVLMQMRQLTRNNQSDLAALTAWVISYFEGHFFSSSLRVGWQRNYAAGILLSYNLRVKLGSTSRWINKFQIL